MCFCSSIDKAAFDGLRELLSKLETALFEMAVSVAGSTPTTKIKQGKATMMLQGEGAPVRRCKKEYLIGGEYDSLAKKVLGFKKDRRLNRIKRLVNLLEEENHADILDPLDDAAKKVGIKGGTETERRVIIIKRLFERVRKQNQYTE